MTLWLIGGRDPTGGAGVDRDLATARVVAPELSLSVVVTAETEQGDGLPARATPRAPAELSRDIATLPPPIAVKLGLVPDPLVDAVIDALRPFDCPVVLDPVLVASDGGALGSSARGLQRVARWATLVTPNRTEARELAGTGTIDADELLEAVAAALAPSAVLLKDGHGDDPDEVCDRLCAAGVIDRFPRARRRGPDPRGTGCALATAIACYLASGVALVEACARAIAWLDEARTKTVFGRDGRPHLR